MHARPCSPCIRETDAPVRSPTPNRPNPAHRFFVRPCRFRVLFTVAAAIAFDRSGLRPSRFSESRTCSYCRSSFRVQALGMATSIPPLQTSPPESSLIATPPRGRTIDGARPRESAVNPW